MSYDRNWPPDTLVICHHSPVGLLIHFGLRFYLGEGDLPLSILMLRHRFNTWTGRPCGWAAPKRVL